MKLAIMQPYFMPYIGYFQLINAVDKFVFLDDVTFIKQGWINRNRILLNDKEHLFSVPIKDISSNKLIKDVKIHQDLYHIFKKKLLKTIKQSYSKSPFFESVFLLFQDILNCEVETINDLAKHSIKSICKYLYIDTILIDSSVDYQNGHLHAQERVLDICKKENTNTYINTIGGKDLYSKDEFSRNGIRLIFLKPLIIEYKQYNNDFVPWLSIIDIMMFNGKDRIKKMLNNYASI